MKRLWLALLLLLACARPGEDRGWFYSAGDWAVPPAYHGNPWAPGGVGVAASYVYEPLFFYVPADGRLLPRLGTGFEESTGRLTVRLEPAARWHDGHPFTSRDVACTFEVGRLKNLEIWAYLERIECPDEHTVVFHWKKASPVNRLRALTEPITSAHHLFGQFIPRQADLQGAREVLFREHPPRPVGTGPFRLTRVTPSDMELERFEGYHQAERVAVKGVRLVRWGRNEVVWSYLFAGEVDALSPACPYDLAEEILRRNPGMRLVTPSDFSEMGILINTRRPPFDRIENRRALAGLLDRDQIRTISSTVSLTIDQTNMGLVQPERWLDRKFLQSLPTTPHRAVRLEGPPVEIMAPSGFTDLALLAEVAASQLSRAGLPARVRLVPGELFSAWMLDGNFDLAASFGAQLGRWVHPSVALSRFFYRQAPLQAGAGLPLVREGVDTHSTVEQLGLETDPERSRQLLQTLLLANSRDLPFIPCFEKRLMIFVQDGRRVSGWPGPEDPLWSAAPLGVEALYCQLLSQGTVR
ncbi:MAG: hypothetical protein AMXMBFR33_52380 [Candidatus Xenobia bacterium]